jgi:hypothetical protein
MIETIGDLIAGILGWIRKGDFEKASGEIGKIYCDVLREDSSFFTKIPEEDMTNKLLQEHNYTSGHLEILAELFNVQAELESARGDYKECLNFSRKSLILFEFIDNEQKTYSYERIKKMEQIRERMRILEEEQ